MWTPTLVLIAVTTLTACATLGGGLYEYLVVDPYWPKRPGIIQPRNGGVWRARFWVPAHIAFEVLLIVTLMMAWGNTDVRIALLIALASHALMRVWSLVDLVPKAVAFEKADPATVDEAAAVRWTRRSLLRLPLDVITCAAMLSALAVLADSRPSRAGRRCIRDAPATTSPVRQASIWPAILRSILARVAAGSAMSPSSSFCARA